jgi:hypothetical protein
MRTLGKWSVVVVASALLACGDDEQASDAHAAEQGHDGEDGAMGAAGPSGEDGEDGSEGRDGADGRDGDPGSDGEDGSDGETGIAGSSCSVAEQADGSKLLSCSDGTSVVVRDGADGTNGDDAAYYGAATGRLIFGDDTAAGVRVLDLATGRVVATFESIAPNAALYTTENGRVAAAFQGALNRVDFIDTGVVTTEHGEARETLPALLPFGLVGEDRDAVAPVHFVSHHGYTTVHFDGRYDEASPENQVTAKSFVIAESDLLDPDGEITTVFETEPQHGVSLVTEEGHVILTAPSTDRAISTAPNGFTVHELTGELVQTIQDPEDFEASCWGLHGETVVGHEILFGCHESLDGGLLVLSWNDTEQRYDSRKLTYPGYPTAPERTSVIKSHPSSAFAIGQWGSFGAAGSAYTGLVRIDPTDTEVRSEHVIQLGSVYCDFELEREEGEAVVALARDGRVHVINVDSWSGHKAAQLFEASDTTCAGRLISGEHVAYVSDTAQGRILEIDLRSLEVVRVFNVGGRPRNMTLARW